MTHDSEGQYTDISLFRSSGRSLSFMIEKAQSTTVSEALLIASTSEFQSFTARHAASVYSSISPHLLSANEVGAILNVGERLGATETVGGIDGISDGELEGAIETVGALVVGLYVGTIDGVPDGE
eukprot:CAMPEP_0202506846 /NCGR_PEP_ID=MMETSP1361-20130828/51348_1 /ASSEMBLY_ACC=CAM_ASM_000849 /TAXON_ID=210615 /ORGANISM="Staurosira complex sp., Strain CCMP2646" /LENGTH=124 /DNA_ID=CAMNT_0049140919 /DNA_START=70 /DNA_END=444 /DNA_ORIENTATION=+